MSITLGKIGDAELLHAEEENNEMSQLHIPVNVFWNYIILFLKNVKVLISKPVLDKFIVTMRL